MRLKKLWLVDCLDGKRAVISKGPFHVGGSNDSHLQLNGQVAALGRNLFTVEKTRSGFQILPSEGIDSFYFDGQHSDFAIIQDNTDHSLVVQDHPFTLRWDTEAATKEWFGGIDPSHWFAYQRSLQSWQGPFSKSDVASSVSSNPEDFLLLCKGMGEMAFYAHHIYDSFPQPIQVPVPSHESHHPREEAEEAEPTAVAADIDTEYGEFTCPVCWFRFNRGDIMSIAVHADLRGDPVLGEEHMIRFHATSFNDRYQAVDAMGLAAPDCACPHCRRRLPPGFLDQPHHIFSIVGAPSSGKSYYLSVLVKMMQTKLFKEFHATFRDASPEDNAVLNDMRNHLFSASRPEDAYLAKTELEGSLYETLPRQGREVRLPKPFIFLVNSRKAPESGFSVVFYDNAGEHFEPGRNSADSPGGQHISVASGIFFLFDPLYSPEFKARIKESNDPQLKQQRNDQQDVILAESEVRIKQILGLTTTERVATPMSILVGKSDAWIDLLGPEPLLPITGEKDGVRTILTTNIDNNSERIRDLLIDINPAIVANAEEISSNVKYFAISPLGHAPVTFTDNEGIERIGPDPKKLNPQHVEDATLWVLSQISPDIFPSDVIL